MNEVKCTMPCIDISLTTPCMLQLFEHEGPFESVSHEWFLTLSHISDPYGPTGGRHFASLPLVSNSIPQLLTHRHAHDKGTIPNVQTWHVRLIK